MATNSLVAYDLEAAFVHGPLSLQGEYIVSELDTDLWGGRRFSGYYAALSWFLSGESRPYKKGAFWRVIPKSSFRMRGEEQGWGAWELALRYSHADLDDGPVRGGKETNITAGVNWYLNANTRVMMNYIHAVPENILYDGNLEILQTRFQVDF